jgi:hypothetical protein
MMEIFASEEANTTYTYSRSIVIDDEEADTQSQVTIANGDFPFTGESDIFRWLFCLEKNIYIITF